MAGCVCERERRERDYLDSYPHIEIIIKEGPV